MAFGDAGLAFGDGEVVLDGLRPGVAPPPFDAPASSSGQEGGPGSSILVFGAVSLIPNVNTKHDEDGPHLSSDGLRLYFTSKRSGAGDADIWVAARSSVTASFDPPVPLPGMVNTEESEEDPTLTDDELTVVFEGTPEGADGALYIATRSSIEAGFGAPSRITSLQGAASGDPTISGDGLQLVFASQRTGGHGAKDLWIAQRATPAAPFGAPVNLVGVNTSADDKDPWIGTHLLFASDRPGGAGDLDIYHAAPDGSMGWSATENLATVNSSAKDSDPFLHAGLRVLILSSDRKDGDKDLYWCRY